MDSALSEIFARSNDFLRRANNNCLPIIESLVNYIERGIFRINVVGGFSRGKSHFINLLIGENLLPEGAIPTTGFITEIAYADEACLEISRGGKIEKTALDSSILESFSLYERDPRVDDDLILRVYVPAPFLESGIVLVDTPGVEDLSDTSASITRNSLQDADAAIVLISALSPLSMTEQAFIAEYMLERQIPLIAAAISFWDQVDHDNGPSQFEYITRKFSRLYPSMPLLLPICHDCSNQGVVCGIDAIRQFIINWSSDPDLQKFKMRAVLGRLGLLVKHEILALHETRSLLKGDVLEAREKIRDAMEELEDNSDSLVEMRINFLARTESLQNEIRESLNNFRETYLSAYGNKDVAEDPLAAATQIYNKLADQVRCSLKADLEILANKLAENCDSAAPLSFAEFSLQEMPAFRLSPKDGADNPLIEELINRALGFSQSYIGRMPFGSTLWPILQPIIIEIIGKARIICPGNEQKLVEKNLAAICSQINHSLGDSLREIYKQVFEQARQHRKTWLAQQREAVSRAIGIGSKQADLAAMDELIETGEKLCTRIHELMEG